MSKKDRIAVVLSILTLFIPIALLIDGEPGPALVMLALLIGYWGYRFIKNDISFLKIKE